MWCFLRKLFFCCCDRNLNPTCWPDLTWPKPPDFVLSCCVLVLFCPVLSGFLPLAMPLAVSGCSETVTMRPVLHRSSYQTEGAGFSPIQSVCLCPLLNLALTLLTLFSSLSRFLLSPLFSSLSFSSLYQARLPSCSSTLSIAEVLLHESQCTVQAFPPTPTTFLTFCFARLLPVDPLSCLLTLLRNRCQCSPQFSLFHLCVCAWMWSHVTSSWYCLTPALYLTLVLFPRKMNNHPSLGTFDNCFSTSQLKLKDAWIMYLNESDIASQNPMCFFLSLSLTPQFL